MAKYEIEATAFLGISHCGAEEATAKGEVELTDEETQQLIGLIKEKRTFNVEKMELENRLPEVYRKLDEAYNKAATTAEWCHWVEDGYYEGLAKYDEEELMDYCIENLYYTEPDSQEYIQYLKDKYGEEHYEEREEDDDYDLFRSSHFRDWLDTYLEGLDLEPRCDFMAFHLGLDVDIFDRPEYEIHIPEAIKAMVKKKKFDKGVHQSGCCPQ